MSETVRELFERAWQARTPPLDLANAIRGLAMLKHATGVEAGVAECKRRLTLPAESRGPAE